MLGRSMAKRGRDTDERHWNDLEFAACNSRDLSILGIPVSGPPTLWYLPGEGHQPAGPFTAEQVLQCWQSGKLRTNTVCWREGMPQWLPLSQVEPFASVIRRAGTTATDQPSPPRSIQGTPTLRGRSPFLSPRKFALVVGASFVGIFAVVLAVGLSHGGGDHVSNGNVGPGKGTRGDAAALADIIASYATRLKEVHNAPQTDIQRREAVAAAVEELKARVAKCGTVAFCAKVVEIIPEGQRYAGSFRWETRDRWGITMSAQRNLRLCCAMAHAPLGARYGSS